MPDFYDFYINVVGLQRAKISGTQISSLCPIREHTKKNLCFSANIDTGQCKCHKGCFSGNAYTLAQYLNIDNPEQWRSNNNYKPMNLIPINTKNRISDDSEEKKTKYTTKKLMKFALDYTGNLKEDEDYWNSIPDSQHGLMGITDDGIETFHYFIDGKCIGIKRHKDKDGNCIWVGDGSCKIFKQQFIKYFYSTIYIVEGERDAIFAPFEAISFSSGCGSIPKDLSQIYVKNNIFIIYDNDKAGQKGAEKLATRIKREKPDINVKVAQWEKGLPDGYDIFDDYKKTQLENDYDYDRLNNAMENAIVYEIKEEVQGYNMVTLGKFLSMKDELPKPEMLIEDLLSRGTYALLSGLQGTGKSMLMNQMAMHMATGIDFLRYKIKKPYKVGILQLENLDGESRDRLETQSKAFLEQYPASRDNLMNNITHKVDVDQGKKFLDAWEKIIWMLDNQDMDALFVDNIACTSDVSFEKNDALKILIRDVEYTARNSNTGLLLVCHHKKTDKETRSIDILNIRGGKILTDFASNVIQLHRSNMIDDWTLMKMTKVRHVYKDINPEKITSENVPQAVVFDILTCLFNNRRAIVHEEPHFKPPNLGRQLEFILSLQKINPDSTHIWETKDFLNQCQSYKDKDDRDVPESTMKKWLPKWVTNGWINRKNQGIYTINWDVVLSLEMPTV